MNLKLHGYHNIITKKLKKSKKCNKCHAQELFQFSATACVCAQCEHVQSVMQPIHYRLNTFVDANKCESDGKEHEPL